MNNGNNANGLFMTPEEYREYGKSLITSTDPEQRSVGVQSIVKAQRRGDLEAAYILGRLILDGMVTPAGKDPEEHGLTILCSAALRGSVQARALLNSYCVKRYEGAVDVTTPPAEGPLTDYDGKKIKIKRKGVMTPVDAFLEYVDGANRLTLSANISFLIDESLEDRSGFRQAVLDGIMEWQGEYMVFGNQLLRVSVELTEEERLWDNVVVVPVTEKFGAEMQKIADLIGTKKSKERAEDMITSKRSFATMGLRWSTKSRKIIYIMSEDGKFDDFEEIKHVAKHEFGHTLGLGDLYMNRKDKLDGVEKGAYAELDGFYLTNKFYNLVMCDHHGPISNNDIEMVVLAFWKNKAQLYQPRNFKGKISKALGRGN